MAADNGGSLQRVCNNHNNDILHIYSYRDCQLQSLRVLQEELLPREK